MEEKVYKQNKISLELLAQLKDTEVELVNAQTYVNMVDAKSRFAYKPIQGDIVDIRLSEYINLHPDRPQLKLLFQRVNQGVYNFG